MSLNWDLSKIKDHGTLCWVPEPEGTTHEGSTYKTLNSVTEHLIWSTVTVGMGEITEANWEEFYARERLQWHVYGGLKLTPGDVHAHIGLKTNVGPVTTAKFNNDIMRLLRHDAAVAVADFKYSEARSLADSLMSE